MRSLINDLWGPWDLATACYLVRAQLTAPWSSSVLVFLQLNQEADHTPVSALPALLTALLCALLFLSWWPYQIWVLCAFVCFHHSFVSSTGVGTAWGQREREMETYTSTCPVLGLMLAVWKALNKYFLDEWMTDCEKDWSQKTESRV